MPDVKVAINDAAGVALIEVKELKEIDDRPRDGDLYVKVTLSPIKSSGMFMSSLHITKEEGGERPPEGSIKISPYVAPLKHNSLEEGKRYWIVFASGLDHERYHQGVVAFWPADTPQVSKALEEAIEKDLYLWKPQLDRIVGLTVGYLLEPDRNRWRIRVSKENKVLWEKIVEGSNKDWRPWFRAVAGGELAGAPQPALVLDVQTIRNIAPDKETGQPGAPVEGAMEYLFEAETGRLLLETLGSEGTPHWRRSYALETGRLVALEIFTMQLLEGPPKDEDLRRESRTYDKNTGELTGTKFYHYGHTERGGTWIPIEGPSTRGGKTK
jgi:hypothetical protein